MRDICSDDVVDPEPKKRDGCLCYSLDMPGTCPGRANCPMCVRLCPECAYETSVRFHMGDPDQAGQEYCDECGWEGEIG